MVVVGSCGWVSVSADLSGNDGGGASGTGGERSGSHKWKEGNPLGCDCCRIIEMGMGVCILLTS